MKKYGFILSIALVSFLYMINVSKSFTAPQFAYAIGSNDTTWTRFKHIKTAVMTYSASADSLSGFVARKFDLAVNPTGSFLTLWQDSAAYYGTTPKCIRYMTTSSFRPSIDFDGGSMSVQQFCTETGNSLSDMWYNVDEDSTVELNLTWVNAACGTETSNGGDSLLICIFGSQRVDPDLRNQCVWDWYYWKAKKEMGSTYDGVVEDEACVMYHYDSDPNCNGFWSFPIRDDGGEWVQGSPAAIEGWDNMTHDEIRDSLIYLKRNVFLPKLMDSFYVNDKMRFPNAASYGVVGGDILEDVYYTGSGVAYGEYMWNRPLSANYAAVTWQFMDSMAYYDTGYAKISLSIDGRDTVAEGGLARCQMNRLTYYYMAADYEHCFFQLINQSSNANSFTKGWQKEWLWFDAIEYDVGQPDSARYVCTTGTDGASQSFDMYRRDYTKTGDTDIVILYREYNGSNNGSASAVTYQLGGNYKQLNTDGTFGETVTSVAVRNADGVIMVAQSAGEDN